ncbi:MAG: WYL domain-containing protein, partial [Pseudomonadota bacterium]
SLGCVSKAFLRDMIREERKLRLVYRDGEEVETRRVVRPIALIYHVDCVMLAAWCELRSGFRHFRCDRIWVCEPLEERFEGRSAALREVWAETNSFAPTEG